jgi:hypothetical protein
MKRTAALLVVSVLAASTIFVRASLPAAAAVPLVSQLEARASQIVNSLVAGDYAGVMAQADSSMNTTDNQAALQNAWMSYAQIMGDFQSTGQPLSVNCGSQTVEQVPVQFSNGSGNVQLTFNDDGTLAGLFILPAATPVLC